MISMRFDLRVPGMDASAIAHQYRAAVGIARWGDQQEAPFQIGLCEHHASPDGYMPSPMVMASAMAAVTTRTPMSIAALLLPFYDPIRLAEDIIVLDHLSGGRVSYVLGIGYRPEEYALYGLEFDNRGALAEEKLSALLAALEHAGSTDGDIGVTPLRRSDVRRLIAWGGGSKAAVKRAGRHGLNFFGQNNFPGLHALYEETSRAAGFEPGMCYAPDAANPNIVFVADDIDRAWEEVGPALLHDAMSYAAWNENAGRDTISLSQKTSLESLREEQGAYRIVNVDGAVELYERWGRLALHPLCGGLTPNVAQRYLNIVMDSVWPKIKPLVNTNNG